VRSRGRRRGLPADLRGWQTARPTAGDPPAKQTNARGWAMGIKHGKVSRERMGGKHHGREAEMRIWQRLIV
jgi:hypothetical protein